MGKHYRHEVVALFGTPVDENPTGAMQEAAFAAAGLNWRYLTLEVPPNQLGPAMRGALSMGFRGLNLTIPHKVAVMEHLDALSPEAALIGAVNTVRREGDMWIGENTDGRGFLRALREKSKGERGTHPIEGANFVLLGAGGAARAIAAELILAGAASLTVVNRSQVRGRLMVDDLADKTDFPIGFTLWEPPYVVPANTDVLVNATSVGLYPDVDAMPAVDLSRAGKHLLVCDAVFNPPQTRLLREAAALGLATLDGLSMLVYQGVTGFELWTGQSAPEAIMKQALRQELDTLESL
jgi:shikimate dehydrogenase